MQMLSEDDLDLKEMTDEELERAWDLWFDLAQTTNDADPPYTHGVLVGLGPEGAGDREQIAFTTEVMPARYVAVTHTPKVTVATLEQFRGERLKALGK